MPNPLHLRLCPQELHDRDDACGLRPEGRGRGCPGLADHRVSGDRGALPQLVPALDHAQPHPVSIRAPSDHGDRGTGGPSPSCWGCWTVERQSDAWTAAPLMALRHPNPPPGVEAQTRPAGRAGHEKRIPDPGLRNPSIHHDRGNPDLVFHDPPRDRVAGHERQTPDPDLRSPWGHHDHGNSDLVLHGPPRDHDENHERQTPDPDLRSPSGHHDHGNSDLVLHGPPRDHDENHERQTPDPDLRSPSGHHDHGNSDLVLHGPPRDHDENHERQTLDPDHRKPIGPPRPRKLGPRSPRSAQGPRREPREANSRPGPPEPIEPLRPRKLGPSFSTIRPGAATRTTRGKLPARTSEARRATTTKRRSLAAPGILSVAGHISPRWSLLAGSLPFSNSGLVGTSRWRPRQRGLCSQHKETARRQTANGSKSNQHHSALT